MLEQIISKFGDKYGYVSNIEAVLETIQTENEELDDDTIRDLIIAINNNNISIFNKINEENKKLLKVEELKKTTNSIKKEEKKTKEVKQQEQSKEYMPDISYYILQINELIKNNKVNYENIEDILPSKADTNWKLIVDLIYLWYKRKIVKLTKEKHIEEELEVKELYDLEIIDYQNVNNHLLAYKKEIKDSKKETKHDIKILFDPETIEKDLSNIATEKYGLILYVLEELKRNVLKNPKTFRNDLVKNLISELRANEIRMFFEKVDADTYMIYYVFVKTTQNNTIYRSQLIKRANDYFWKKDNLLSKFNDEDTKEEYLKEASKLTEKIISLLSNNKNNVITDSNIDQIVDDDEELGNSL